MKKFFYEPEMNISIFDVENVVTASGGTGTDPTPELSAQEQLNKIDGITTANTMVIDITQY